MPTLWEDGGVAAHDDQAQANGDLRARLGELRLTPLRGDFPAGTAAQPYETWSWRAENGLLVVLQTFRTDDPSQEVLESIFVSREGPAERSVISVSPADLRATVERLGTALEASGAQPLRREPGSEATAPAEAGEREAS